MSTLNHQIFYRKYGVRNLGQLMAPVLSSSEVFSLPLKSIYHHVTYDGIAIGPAADEAVFKDVVKPIFIDNVTQLGDYQGSPRRVPANEQGMLKDLRMHNRRLRPLRTLESVVKDPTTLVVYNYCFIGKMYRYVRSAFTEYHKWSNTFSTIVEKMAEVATLTDNQQYLLAGIPQVIPSLSQFSLASQGITQPLLAAFRDPNAYLSLEIWKWIGDERDNTILGKIPKEKLHLINLVFQETGRWCVINLGYLDAMRLSSEKDDKSLLDVGQRLPGDQLQKRYLRFLMRVMEARTVTANTDDDQDKEIESLGELPPGAVSVEPAATSEADISSGDLVTDEDGVTETDEDRVARLMEEEHQLDKDLAVLNDIANKRDQVDPQTSDLKTLLTQEEPESESIVLQQCDRLADEGLLTAGEYRRFQKLAVAYKEIKAPTGEGTLAEYIHVDPKNLVIPDKVTFRDSDTVLDKSMLKSSLMDFDQIYQKHALAKHTAAMVTGVQKAGVIVTDYTVEKSQDALGAYESHTVKLVPIEGAPSTLRFKLPSLNEDGTFTANGVNYRMRKQFGDTPIRKVAPDKVALTSYYGKAFVKRGRRRIHDYGYWLQTEIMSKAVDQADADITDAMPGNVFNPDLKAPRTYSAIAMSFRSMKARGFQLNFDPKDLVGVVPESVVQAQEKLGNIVIGYRGTQVLTMDFVGSVYILSEKNSELMGSLEQFLNLDTGSSPVEYAELVVFGQDIPLGLVLSYYLGFTKVLQLLKATPRRVDAGKRASLGIDEYALVFSDETLIFSREDKLAALILGGFKSYHRAIRAYSVHSLDKRAVYLNLLEANSTGVRYLREMDLMLQMFVDPITKSILKEMGEPETFTGLLFRAADMLLVDAHPNELDLNHMRIKGSERLAGAVYTELVQALRMHNAQMGKSNKRIEMNPYAVWKRVSEDSAKSQISEINPIQALKEEEAVTYVGEGGRNTRSMTKSTREFHPSHIGVISEATVDSSDTGVNVFLSANPKFKSAMGLIDTFDFKKDGASSMVSTSVLLAPGSERDDIRRAAFVSIQQGHSIACEGYHQPTIRTGYEEIIAQRSGDLFAMTATKPGVVKAMEKKGIIVEYEDGEIKGYEVGRRFGNAAGLTIPHDIVTPLKVGQRFDVGDAIVYNKGFFEPDVFNSKRIVFKNAVNVPTALWESGQTLEDASAISPRVADRLRTHATKVKTITVSFTDAVHKLVKVGDKVNYDSVLCIIADSVTSNAGAFDADTLDTLKVLSSQSPRAGVQGVVERIEVFYHGDLEDMSQALRNLALASDKDFKEHAKNLNRTAYTGSVDGGFRIDGTPLGLDQVAIRVYITAVVPAGIGDKGVFGNQLKTVFSEVMEGDYVTEKGQAIEAIFGYKSIDARIVNSPFLIGTTNTLLEVIAKKAVEIYNK
jgi:hypothetical protein